MAPPEINEVKAIQAVLGSLLLGVFYVTFHFALRKLLFSKGQLKNAGQIQWLLLAVTIVMAINATLHVATSAVQIYHALNQFCNAPKPDQAFINDQHWINLLQTFILNFQNSIGDGILIYRCWVVWGYKWTVIALSVLLWLADAAFGIYTVYYMAAGLATTAAGSRALTPFMNSWWAITIPLNVITTGLIIYRLFSVDKENRPFSRTTVTSTGKGRSSNLRYVMKILIESGSLYTTSALITFILVTMDNSALYIMATVTVVIIGIAFNLITVRTGRNLGRSTNSYNTSQTAGSAGHSISFHQPMSTIVGHNVPLQTLASQDRSYDLEASKGNSVLITRDVVRDHSFEK